MVKQRLSYTSVTLVLVEIASSFKDGLQSSESAESDGPTYCILLELIAQETCFYLMRITNFTRFFLDSFSLQNLIFRYLQNVK